MKSKMGKIGNFWMFVLVLLALVVVATAYNSSNTNKGFGKPSAPNAKGKNPEKATDVTRLPEETYLEPFALKLHGSTTARTVRTMVDKSPGDVLLEIPLQDTITVEHTLSRLGETCDNGKSKDYCDEQDDMEDEEEALALALLRLRYDATDPYVSSVLPKEHSNVWTLSEDLWKEVSVLLPRCYSETFAATRQRVHRFARKTSVSGNTFTLDDALWAFSMVRSRSLAVPELDGNTNYAIIPGLDLLNHDFGSGAQLELVTGDNGASQKWIVSSSKAIKAGDEVCLSYGDTKDNWKLLLTYGFAVSDNPNQVVFWNWRDLLDASSVIRPDTFTKTICLQLMKHPQLEPYTIFSEDRATFSYDVMTQTPRDSLSNGLLVLSNLASQLGKPEGDPEHFHHQVLRELLRRRTQELEEGLLFWSDKKDDALETFPYCKSFLDSVEVALRSELQHLKQIQ